MFLKISSFFPHNESQELSWECQRTPKSKLNRDRFCKPTTQLHLPLRKFAAANLEHQQFSDRVSSSYTRLPPPSPIAAFGSSVLSTLPCHKEQGTCPLVFISTSAHHRHPTTTVFRGFLAWPCLKKEKRLSLSVFFPN